MQNQEVLSGHGGSKPNSNPPKMKRSGRLSTRNSQISTRNSQSTSSLLAMRPRAYKSFRRMTTHDGTLPPKGILKNKNGSSRFLAATGPQASFSKRVSFSDSMNNRWNSQGSKVNLQASAVNLNEPPNSRTGNITWKSQSHSTATKSTKTTLNIGLEVLKEEMKKVSPPPKPSRRTSKEEHGLPIRPKRTNSNDCGASPFQTSLDSFHSALLQEARSCQRPEVVEPLEWPSTPPSLEAPVQPKRRASLEETPEEAMQLPNKQPQRRTSLILPEDFTLAQPA